MTSNKKPNWLRDWADKNDPMICGIVKDNPAEAIPMRTKPRANCVCSLLKVLTVKSFAFTRDSRNVLSYVSKRFENDMGNPLV